jgi:hypothetical protein
MNHGTMLGLEVELFNGRRRLVRKRVARVGPRGRPVLVRVRGHAPAAGRYSVVARQGHRSLARRAVKVR